MPSLARSFRLLKEGFNGKLFWTYWLEFKEKAWEVFWGPTVLGVAFGVYTIWHSPALPWFLLYVLAVVFLTGYYLWRVNHVRLEKKIEIGQVRTQEWTVEQGSANAGHHARAYYFEVFNRSEGTTIEDVNVQLNSISPKVANLDWLPVHLRLQHNNPDKPENYVRSFNLNPHELRNIDFVAALKGNTIFTVSHVATWANDVVPFDTEGHRLQVKITARHTPHLLAWFKVWRDEDEFIKCELENERSTTD